MFAAFSSGLPRNFARVFLGRSLKWHATLIALTALCVLSGFDWWYFEHTRGAFLQAASLPAAIIGFFVPVLLPVILYVIGEWRHRAHLRRIADALAQAGIIGYVVSIIYKTFTGRVQPEFLTHLSTVDNSRDFMFGFLKHGVFWGWPSSHTTVAVAMSAALWLLVPSPAVRALAALYALYIAFGVSMSIHWFSDALAGAILGTLVGVTVAASYRPK